MTGKTKTKPWDNFRGFWKRSTNETVLNTPMTVVVGGCRKGIPAKTIEIREPSNKRSGAHLKMLLNAIQAVVVKNHEWIRSVQSDPTQITASDVMNRIQPVIPALTGFLADITETDAGFVENDMSPKQTSLVLMAYVRAVGMDTIRNVFMSAVIQWRTMTAELTATPKATTNPGPYPFPDSAE